MYDAAFRIAESTWRKAKPLTAARDGFAALGLEYCPMGEQTSKGVPPGFYRGVGTEGNGTCPPNCPLLPRTAKAQGPCYAAGYHCRQSAKRAPIGIAPAVRSFVTVGNLSLRRDLHPARMLNSGDLCRQGKLDHELVDALCTAGAMLADRVGLRQGQPGAYGYTRVPDAAALVERFAKHGIAMLRSGYYGPGGAVIWPIEHIELLRAMHPHVTFAACAHHTRGVACRVCDLCHTAPQRGHCVVLHPHGNHGKRLARQCLESVQ
jgi:hypothetical protein